MVPRARGAVPADVAATIAGMVDSAVHPDLRWPRFPDFQDDVRRAYQSEQFAPLWLRDGKPTPQATAAIAALATANDKGLDARDYDAAPLAAMADTLRTTADPTTEQIAAF